MRRGAGLGFRSLHASSYISRGRLRVATARTLAVKTGTADPKIHSDEPQDEDAEAAVKGAEAAERQQEEIVRKGGEKETEPPSAIGDSEMIKKPFSTSLKLESSELGDPLDPTFQQKRRRGTSPD